MSRAALVATLVLVAAVPLTAQGAGGKKVLTIDDYAKWRTVSDQEISPDGKWVAYGLRYLNTLPDDAKPVLHLRNIATKQEVEVADATQPVFSPDAKWVAYQVSPPLPKKGGRGGNGDSTAAGATRDTTKKPATVPQHWELRDLATGKTWSWQNIESAAFSPDSTHLLLRRKAGGNGAGAGGGRGGGGGSGGASGGTGTDVILHDLRTGGSVLLGSVGEAAFNRTGKLLAYTVDSPVRDGNGLFVMQLADGATRPLDNDSLRYSRITWNDRGTGLAVLKGREVEKKRERRNVLLVFADLASAPTVLDPATADGFPKGFDLSERSALSWSDDGRLVYVGIIPQTNAPDTAKRKSTDSLANVDVWGTEDERIQSVQMNQADQDRNRTFTQGFVVATGKFVPLTDSSMRNLELPATGTWAVGNNPQPYLSDYKPPAADYYLVNTLTGERTPFLTAQLTAHSYGISPDGTSYLYWKDAKWWSYDFATHTARALGGSAPPSFVNTEYDYAGTKPPYGIAGYAADGSGVIAYQRFDAWLLPLDGRSAPRNLTAGEGSRGGVVYRYVQTTAIDSSTRRGARARREIDLSRPVTFSSYGEYTKKAGFSRLSGGKLESLVFDDAAYGRPERAGGADRFLWTRETFREFPDLRISGPDFTDAEQISHANPQQSEYRWGRRILFDFTTRRGDKLQGILAIPDDYLPGEKRPMLVTFYEKNSQTLNRYPTPSYLSSMGQSPIEAVSRGYLTMLPDVKFHLGTSHSDMLDAVEAATKKVIAMGYADPAKIGLHGHSYGGEGAAFIGTRSRLFAAVGDGAGVTDLFTDFSQSWGWSYQVAGGSGDNGSQYYLNGQGRWGFSPWDNPERYHFESALTHVREVTAPFLLLHGTADPTVSFSEGMNFYNALRFNGKQATMLAYIGEGHGLRGLANRRDFTQRFFEFFDHYLRSAPAPKWMTDGVPYLVKEAEKH
jgi:dipeptidyl aminopeptidase/acylaminoacyl peptidase